MLSFREFLNETSGTTGTTVKPKNKFELIDIIEETIVDEGYNCSLNFIDTSLKICVTCSLNLTLMEISQNGMFLML